MAEVPPAKKIKTEEKLFVTVVGGGNSTAIFAVLCKHAGHDVAILTRRPTEWSTSLAFDNEDENYLGGKTELTAEIDVITDKPEECIPQSDMIFIAGLPIHHNPAVLKDLVAPHLDREKPVMIGTICAYGGFNWVVADALGEGNYVIMGTQLIPWCCGTKEYGKRGVVFGAKRMLRIPTEDGKDPQNIKAIMSKILQIEDMRDTDFLVSTLWPNNPSLHPPILYGIFKDWDGETPYNKEDVPLRIYAELTDASAEALETLDKELVSIIDGLKTHYPENKSLQEDFHLRSCILENYLEQVTDKTNLATTVKTCKAFGKHNVPYKEVSPGKVVPILAHKFFETDLPFGLCTWKDIAVMLNIEIPFTDAIIEWNQKLINKEYLKDGTISGKDAGECILPSSYGLNIDNLNSGRR
mmetsp:Transcript_4675/g.8248  ORF Transcript_4675/g.8248 Transcript_4675/m.8248 type:complete len:411 (-) Transcript_4675:1042-2274(-)|eukprot:CAMPEP_0184549096 /NCGR_PEP_ID=MMETSP0199_2-20130426/6596_1 /TAXON_ID=1112570 /ORGANISM="Thraustochytrium sp., Strain LLF1b" /LENGTH=410 /DNA_ID=CAMNT_0026943781 /DNA_START=44 /DNA_END=1276 /DNA_ORIENTATION=-